MQPQELTALVTGLANAIYSQYTPEEVATLSIVLVQLGTTLATLTALGSNQANGTFEVTG